VTGQFAIEQSHDLEVEGRIRRLVNLPPQNLLVDIKTGGIADIVLTLRVAKGASYPSPHPEYDIGDKVVRRTAINNVIQPRVTLIRTGEQWQLTNALADAVEVKVDTIRNKNESVKLNPNAAVNLQFEKEERFPVLISLFPPTHLTGLLVIRDSPYMAVTDSEGRFKIANLPVGDWTFQVWHERSGYVTEVRRGDASESWPSGQFQIHVQLGGQQDLGKIEVSLDNFDKTRP
jgi:hypothetical protein